LARFLSEILIQKTVSGRIRENFVLIFSTLVVIALTFVVVLAIAAAASAPPHTNFTAPPVTFAADSQ
jgi:hypothetical protein